MIRHIVFFTCKSKAELATVRNELLALATIPHSSVFEVKENRRVDLYANEIDLVVYAEFADQLAFDTFKSHPLYEETTARVRPMRNQRYAADIEAGCDKPRL